MAWKKKDSFHKLRAKKELQEITAIQENDERKMSQSRILGITDLNKGEDPRA